MALLSAQVAPGPTGAVLSFVVAGIVGSGDALDQFENHGREYIFIRQGSGPVTVTVLAVNDPYGRGEGVSDEVHVVAANTTRWFGPYRPTLFNDDDNLVTVKYDDPANTQVAIARAP